MKITNSLSDNEKNLLFLLFTLLILFSAYQFGFVKFTDKAEQLQSENLTLTSKLNELQIKKNQEKKYIAETVEYEEKIAEMLNDFPTRITQEKNIMLITELEEYAKITVSSITFQDISKFYTSNLENSSLTNVVDDMHETSIDVRVDDENEVNDGIKTNEENGTAEENKNIKTGEYIKGKTMDLNITGYTTSIVLTYQASYQGLKKCIEFINNNKEKMNITEISAAFDNTTGNLTGTLTISVYALAGIKKGEEEVTIPGIDLGMDNIFNSIEIPKIENN